MPRFRDRESVDPLAKVVGRKEEPHGHGDSRNPSPEAGKRVPQKTQKKVASRAKKMIASRTRQELVPKTGNHVRRRDWSMEAWVWIWRDGQD